MIPSKGDWSADTLATLKANGVEMITGRQLKNYKALKKKIICTDELIGKFRRKLDECSQLRRELFQAQEQLSAVSGLRAELQATHEECNQLRCREREVLERFEFVEIEKQAHDVTIAQLTEQVKELRQFREEHSIDYEVLRKEKFKLKEERDRFQKRFVQARKELDGLKHETNSKGRKSVRRRRGSNVSTSSSLTSLTSPTYAPLLGSPLPSTVAASTHSQISPLASGGSSLSLRSPLTNGSAASSSFSPSLCSPLARTSAASSPLSTSSSSFPLLGSPLASGAAAASSNFFPPLGSPLPSSGAPLLSTAFSFHKPALLQGERGVITTGERLSDESDASDGEGEVGGSDLQQPECVERDGATQSREEDSFSDGCRLLHQPSLVSCQSAGEMLSVQSPMSADMPVIVGLCTLPVGPQTVPTSSSLGSPSLRNIPNRTLRTEAMLSPSVLDPCALTSSHVYPQAYSTASDTTPPPLSLQSHLHSRRATPTSAPVVPGNSALNDTATPTSAPVVPGNSALNDTATPTSAPAVPGGSNYANGATPTFAPAGLDDSLASLGLSCSDTSSDEESESDSEVSDGEEEDVLASLLSGGARVEWAGHGAGEATKVEGMDGGSRMNAACYLHPPLVGGAISIPIPLQVVLPPHAIALSLRSGPSLPLPPTFSPGTTSRASLCGVGGRSLTSGVVAAAADSASDSEFSLSELDCPLSPLPPSPHPRLPSISPLPPSPPLHCWQPSGAVPLSPLPPSPIAAEGRAQISPLSPLPLSPCPIMVSPLPPSPEAPLQHSPAHFSRSLPLPSFPALHPSSPLLVPTNFADSAPRGLHIPKPFSISSPPSSVGPLQSPPYRTDFKLSDSSLFSPVLPLPPSRVGSSREGGVAKCEAGTATVLLGDKEKCDTASGNEVEEAKLEEKLSIKIESTDEEHPIVKKEKEVKGERSARDTASGDEVEEAMVEEKSSIKTEPTDEDCPIVEEGEEERSACHTAHGDEVEEANVEEKSPIETKSTDGDRPIVEEAMGTELLHNRVVGEEEEGGIEMESTDGDFPIVEEATNTAPLPDRMEEEEGAIKTDSTDGNLPIVEEASAKLLPNGAVSEEEEEEGGIEAESTNDHQPIVEEATIEEPLPNGTVGKEEEEEEEGWMDVVEQDSLAGRGVTEGPDVVVGKRGADTVLEHGHHVETEEEEEGELTVEQALALSDVMQEDGRGGPTQTGLVTVSETLPEFDETRKQEPSVFSESSSTVASLAGSLLSGGDTTTAEAVLLLSASPHETPPAVLALPPVSPPAVPAPPCGSPPAVSAPSLVSPPVVSAPPHVSPPAISAPPSGSPATVSAPPHVSPPAVSAPPCENRLAILALPSGGPPAVSAPPSGVLPAATSVEKLGMTMVLLPLAEEERLGETTTVLSSPTAMSFPEAEEEGEIVDSASDEEMTVGVGSPVVPSLEGHRESVALPIPVLEPPPPHEQCNQAEASVPRLSASETGTSDFVRRTGCPPKKSKKGKGKQKKRLMSSCLVQPPVTSSFDTLMESVTKNNPRYLTKRPRPPLPLSNPSPFTQTPPPAEAREQSVRHSKPPPTSTPSAEATCLGMLPGYQLRSRQINFWERLPGARKRRLSEREGSGEDAEAPSGKTARPNCEAWEQCDSRDAYLVSNLPVGVCGSSRAGTVSDDTPSVVRVAEAAELEGGRDVCRRQRGCGLGKVGVAPEGTGVDVSQSLRERRPTRGVQERVRREEEGTSLSAGTSKSCPAPTPRPSAGPTVAHVLQTDGATGQDEERTPISSPKSDAGGEKAQVMPCPPAQPSVGHAPPPLPPAPATERPSPPGLPAPSSCILDADLSQLISQPLSPVGRTPSNPLPRPPFPRAPPPPGATPPSSQLSLTQQQLPASLQCPLPLPAWLVASMARAPNAFISCSAALKKKKRGNPKDPVWKQPMQSLSEYLLLNLERLVCGHIHLSTAITMLSDVKNNPDSASFVEAVTKFFLDIYHPRLDQIVFLYHSLCDSLRDNPRQADPLDSSFPAALGKTDCQLIACFAHVCRLNMKMPHLLPELTKSLYHAALDPHLNFHVLSHLCRTLTALCRLQGESERVLFFVWDLLHRRPLQPQEMKVLATIAAVWPSPLARRPGISVVERNQLSATAVEQQPLSFTLELIIVSMVGKDRKLHERMLRNLNTLCKWKQSPQPKLTSELALVLMNILRTSHHISIEAPPLGSAHWRRPSPSVVAFRVVHCLRMLAWHLGWVWTNDTLIRAHLWPLLQEWHGEQESVREASVVCAIRLIGFISQQGLSEDPQSSSIAQLQRVLVALLSKGDQQTVSLSLSVQLAAADSLLELSPPHHPQARPAVSAITQWLKSLARQQSGAVLVKEFYTRLQPYGFVSAGST